MDTTRLPEEYTVLAPDGSEIRELVVVKGGSMVHCKLPPGAASTAIRHVTVEEAWYFIQGRGQVWRKRGEQESVVDVEPGVALTIEPGTHFQFRNTGDEDLCFIIVTMPPWPGAQEAVRVEDYWK
jgi:mannose-6-phosphate isomerase-like protein (cupin superfamily)